MQELAWLLEAERNETRRLQEELVKEREGSHISLVEHDKILQEELGKQKTEFDAALTRATKEYIKDLEKTERKVVAAETVLQELAEPIERLSVTIWGKFHHLFLLCFVSVSLLLLSELLLFLGQARRLSACPPRSMFTVSVCSPATFTSRPTPWCRRCRRVRASLRQSVGFSVCWI